MNLFKDTIVDCLLRRQTNNPVEDAKALKSKIHAETAVCYVTTIL